MRAVFVLVVVLAVVAVACVAPVARAQSGSNVTHIRGYNDSTCTRLTSDEHIPIPSSTKCVPGHDRGGNYSFVFTCTTANNHTHYVYDVYNATESCDNAPLVTYESSAPADSCAPMAVSLNWGNYSFNDTWYARIRCEDSGNGVVAAALKSALSRTGTVLKPLEIAPPITAEQPVKRRSRSTIGRLFASGE